MSAREGTVLVTGGSGFIGAHLVAALAGQGRPVRALVRSDEAEARVREAGATETARGDLADLPSLEAAAAGCSLIYHLAGPYRGSASEMHATHTGGTANVLAALEPGARLVYVSSTSVYGWERLWPAGAGTPPRPASAYGEAKVAAENLVRGWPHGSAVIARPTITYGIGDERGMLARVTRLLQRGVRRLPGNGENRVHLLHVDDLTVALLALGDKGEGIFVLGGPEAAPVSRTFGLLAEGAGLPAPSFGLPASALRPVAAAVESAWSAVGLSGEPPISLHSVDVATRDRAYDWSRAADELGWAPQVTLDEGIPPVGRWLASLPAAPSGRGAAASAPQNRVSSVAGNVRSSSLGFDWRAYVTDRDEGLGTVYERFALRDVLREAVDRTGATSILHAPQFGMMGFPGLDTVFLAREGLRVGLLDFDKERLDAVVTEWRSLGLDPEVHLVPGPDPSTWPDQLPVDYDLVFSFAALWWFDDPWAVVDAQTRWARKGLLSCVPNKNVFMRMRARLWHQDLFEQLNENALDARAMTAAGERSGFEAVDTGLFDIPPFPDTSVPLAKVLRAALGRNREEPVAVDGGPDGDEAKAGTWEWSIIPYFHGEQPDLEARIARIARWERFLPGPLAPGLAHHRYVLFVDPTTSRAAASAGAQSADC